MLSSSKSVKPFELELSAVLFWGNNQLVTTSIQNLRQEEIGGGGGVDGHI